MPIIRLEYQYDAYGRRTEKKTSTWTSNSFQVTRINRFAYDRWNLIAEWEASSPQISVFTLVRTHHWGLDLSGTLNAAGGVGGLVLSRYHQPNGQTTSCVPAFDGNGNVIAMLDSVTGKRAAEYEYGPFGELLRSTGPLSSANPFRFSTKYQDDATGLLYYGYRYYSAESGRWIGRDPIGEAGGANLYGMVGNNPVNSVDPMGLRTESITYKLRANYFYDQRYAGNGATGEGWATVYATFTYNVPEVEDIKSELLQFAGDALNGFRNAFKRDCEDFCELVNSALDAILSPEELLNKLRMPSWEDIQDAVDRTAQAMIRQQVEELQRTISAGRAAMAGDGSQLRVMLGNKAGEAVYEGLKLMITGGASRLAKIPGCTKPMRDAKGRFAKDPNKPPSPYKYKSSDRRRDWKREAENPTRDDYTADDLARMRKGLPPERFNPDKGAVESMERSHEPTPLRDGGTETVPRWPQEHAEVDPHRHPGY
jgi:RHS repeat-associated protein